MGNSSFAPGKIDFFYGFDSSLLRTVSGIAGIRIGRLMTNMGDLNADGFDDLAVSADSLAAGGVGSFLRILSGLDGSDLFVISDPMGDFKMGSIEDAGDVDNDGTRDVMVAQPEFGGPLLFPISPLGRVQIFSGVDGGLIRTHTTIGTSSIGNQAVGVGDVNGDGFDDYAFNKTQFMFGFSTLTLVGATSIHSGFDGAILATLGTSQTNSNVGSLVLECPGDLDGDGICDLAVSFFGGGISYLNLREIRVFSLATMTEIANLPIVDIQGSRTIGAESLGDLNGDSVGDLATLAVKLHTGLPIDHEGQVRVYFGGVSPVAQLFSGSGQVPGLTLDWLPENGNPNEFRGSYLASGATPFAQGQVGASFSPADIPIQGVDLLIAIDNQNLLLTANLVADASGQFAVGNLTRRIPSLAGSTLFVQMFETSPMIKASNAIQIKITP